MKPTFWTNPIFHVFLCSAFVTVAEIFLKIGADKSSHIQSSLSWLGVNGLGSIWIWLGMLGTLASLGSWLYALRSIPLNVAFLLSHIVHVTVPVSCLIFLHETISPRRWIGITMVLLGVLVVAKPFAKIEEKL